MTIFLSIRGGEGKMEAAIKYSPGTQIDIKHKPRFNIGML